MKKSPLKRSDAIQILIYDIKIDAIRNFLKVHKAGLADDIRQALLDEQKILMQKKIDYDTIRQAKPDATKVARFISKL